MSEQFILGQQVHMSSTASILQEGPVSGSQSTTESRWKEFESMLPRLGRVGSTASKELDFGDSRTGLSIIIAVQSKVQELATRNRALQEAELDGHGTRTTYDFNYGRSCLRWKTNGSLATIPLHGQIISRKTDDGSIRTLSVQANHNKVANTKALEYSGDGMLECWVILIARGIF
jgi:hypothetical protein